MKLDEHGWARTEDLIAGIAKSRPFDMQMLEEIVRTDSKQRYSFNEDKTLIRANQGHSIPVDVELEQKTPPDVLWHGTGEKYVESINRIGLIPKSRLYVHLSKDYEIAKTVGNRHEKPEDYSQEDDAGLDLLDFYVLPHYLTAPFKKVTEKIMTEFSDLNLCPINNRQGIVIDGEGSKVVCKD